MKFISYTLMTIAGLAATVLSIKEDDDYDG